MTDEVLEQELASLKAELEAAKAESIRLNARISGLGAQRDALAAALAEQRAAEIQEAAAAAPVPLVQIKKRTEAIEAILRHEGHAMSIEEVREALHERWDDSSEYAVVASTLNLLHRKGRIAKVARGRYAAA